jgi:hypothetical protein
MMMMWSMHLDSAITLGFHVEDHWRGVGEVERWAI